MGYDLVVSDESKRVRLGYVELTPEEQFAVEELARANGFPILASFPKYWGHEAQIPVGRLRALLGELSRFEGLSAAKPEVLSAANKLRQVVAVALQHGRPLGVIPD